MFAIVTHEGEHLARRRVDHRHHARSGCAIAERADAFLQCDQVPVQITDRMRLPDDRILLEERQSLPIAGLLAVVDQRNALAQHRQHDAGFECRAEPLELGCLPGVLIVVAQIGHSVGILRPGALVLGVIAVERGYIGLADGDPMEGVVPTPGVAGVEGAPVDIAALVFGEHEDRLDGIQFGPDGLPEVERHITGDIAAKPVDADLADPELHGLGHVAAQFRIAVIEIDDVRPIPPWSRAEVAAPVTLVPVRMRLDQRIVPGGVVGHPVENHPHAQPVRLGDECLEIVQRAEFRIDTIVVAYRVRTAQAALAVLLADRMDRHEPQDVRAKRLQARQLRTGGDQGAFGRELTGVDLVQHGGARPVRMVEPDIRFRPVRGLRRCRIDRRHGARRRDFARCAGGQGDGQQKGRQRADAIGECERRHDGSREGDGLPA